MPITLNGDTGITTPMYNGSIAANAVTPSVNMKNRLINGQMVIDQRNSGASVTQTTSSFYTLDRWKIYGTAASKFSVQQNAGSVTPPAGFTNYLGCTSLSSYSVSSSDEFILYQPIEGFNTADLNWGSANAKTITLSFWVRSSLTGTFGGALRNSAANRSYPYTYTISAANTWEQKSVTIAGDTSGTWIGATNGVGIEVLFGLGQGASTSGTAGAWASSGPTNATGATSVVGTNGATFYVTGVQFEVSSAATNFDYRPYTTELQLCQRYLPTANVNDYYAGLSAFTNTAYPCIRLPVTARVAPTGVSVSSIAGYTTTNGSGSPIAITAIALAASGVNSSLIQLTVASGLTAGQASVTLIGTAPLLFTGCEL